MTQMITKPTALLILVACAIFMESQESSAARLIRAEVSYDGKLVLEGSTSDDGHMDADAAWDYLKTMKFRPTDAFKTLDFDPSVKETVLLGSSKGVKGVALADCRITVSIAYGGESKFRELTLTRVIKDAHGREWMLDPGEIDKWFAYRLISRKLASELRKPNKLNP